MTTAELASWLGISTRRVKELRADGRLPGGSGDPYHLKECVQAFCRAMRPDKRGTPGEDGDLPPLDAAKLRVYAARADALEMLNDQMRGATVLADDMVIVVCALLEAVRAKMLAIPTKAAPVLVGVKVVADVRDRLTDLVHEALHEIADAEPVCDTVRTRARDRAGRAVAVEEDLPDDAAPAAPDGEPVG